MKALEKYAVPNLKLHIFPKMSVQSLRFRVSKICKAGLLSIATTRKRYILQ